MTNRIPIYLFQRLEGKEENEHFGERIVTGDINGDGKEEWIIAASQASRVEGDGGVNPQAHYFVGKVYVYSSELKLLFTLEGEQPGERFGTSLQLGDVNGDGVLEIIAGSPRASHDSLVQCGSVSVYSGADGKLLHRWYGCEDYARLGTELAAIDWNRDGAEEIAAASHVITANGMEGYGRVSVYAWGEETPVVSWTGSHREAFGMSLSSGDVDGDGYDELVVGAPYASVSGLIRNGQVMIFSSADRAIRVFRGERSYDQFGQFTGTGDADGDGIQDLLVGSPSSSGEHSRSGSFCVYSVAQNKKVLNRKGWFGRQGLGQSVQVLSKHPQGVRYIASARSGSLYYMDEKGEVLSQAAGDNAEAFSQTITIGRQGNWIAVGAVSSVNQTKFMSGSVTFFANYPPARGKSLMSGPVKETKQEETEQEPKQDQAMEQPAASQADDPKRKLNILLATYWYLPHVGGVDLYVRTLKQLLENAGHQVDVLAHHPDMVHYYLVDGEKKIEKWQIKRVIFDKVYRFYQKYLPHVDPWVRYRDIERYSLEAAAVLFDLDQYDVIHTQDIISTRALSRVKPDSAALVATIHGLLAKEHLIAGTIESKESLAWKYVSDEEYYGCVSADETIVPTEWLSDEMTQFEVPKDRLKVIPYGMDIPAFEQKLQQPLTRPVEKKAELIISCPARMVPVKGHFTLIEALEHLAADLRWHCWFIGDGPMQKEIMEKIAECELVKRITLLGNRDDVPALLKQSDLMVLPSLQDNLPFSIMEAQLAGIPIVASNAGGIPEMIEDGKTGLLFEKGSSQALAHQIAVMLRDSSHRSRIASQAKQWALAHWSDRTMLDRTLRVYEAALLGSGKGAKTQ